MLRDLVLAGAYGTFLVLGAAAPFVFGLGYLWVDTFYPQLISYSLLKPVPVSLIMAACAIGGYLALDRRAPPKLTLLTVLILLYAGWMTLSLSWAVAPAAAAEKYDWAFKTVMFSVFVPFLFRSRVQIEAFLQVFLFSALQAIFPTAVKTLLTGGGYGFQYGLVAGNSGLSESSYLAAVSIALIPIVLYLRDNSVLFPQRYRWWFYTGFVPMLLACAIGTYARTALIGFVIVGVSQFLRAKRKLAFLVVCVMLAGGGYLATASKWSERIETATDASEGSSYGRILVWQWTIGWVASHPLGGSFNAYLVDEITFPPTDGKPAVVVHGKAFHNIYIEVLGELGYFGLGLFLCILGASFATTLRLLRRTRGAPALAWVRSLTGAVCTASLTLLFSGMFIGVGFQALVWYMIVLPMCLMAYVRRAEAPRRALAASRTWQRAVDPAAIPAGLGTPTGPAARLGPQRIGTTTRDLVR